MLGDIFLGRELTEKTFDNIKNILSSLLEKEDKDDLIVNLNVIEDDLSLIKDNDIYTIFQIKVFEVFNIILLKYGIFINNEINFSVYEKIFYVLFSIKYIDYNKEEMSIIINGDFQDEDKLNLIFSLYFEETSDVIDCVDVSEMFFNFIENSIKEEKSYNIEMMQRAIQVNSETDSTFKNTILYTDILKGDVIYDLDLLKDEVIIIQELVIRTNRIEILEDKIKEIVFTLMFYNKDNLVNIKTFIKDEFINLTFDNVNDKQTVKDKILHMIENYRKD